MQDVDRKIEALIARKRSRTATTQIPGQEAHEILVEQGQDKLAPSAPAGDVTIRFSEEPKPQGPQRTMHGPQVTLIEMPSNQPDEAAVVTVGAVRFFPNPLDINTYEAKFTKGGMDPYVVEVKGRRLSAWEGLAALYEAIRAQRSARPETSQEQASAVAEKKGGK